MKFWHAEEVHLDIPIIEVVFVILIDLIVNFLRSGTTNLLRFTHFILKLLRLPRLYCAKIDLF